MYKYLFLSFITILSIFQSNYQNVAADSKSSIQRLFNRFSEFLKELRNPNIQYEASFLNHLLHMESQLSNTRVWLTVSSVVNVTGHNDNDDHRDLLVRALEIHWRRPKPPQHGDYLALHRVNDSIQIRTYPLVDHRTNKTFPRYYKTDLEFNYPDLTNLSPKDKDNCLEYFVTYVNNNGQIESKNCIRMQSRWMEKEFDMIKDRTLSQIMLPGTHDASSYEKYEYNVYEMDVLNRFQFTQDETLYNQLAYGIRYLDCRVAVYNQTNHTNDHHYEWIEEFWMVHDLQRNHITLKQALRQVLRFLEQTTHEIVIVDFHRFVHGFDGEKDLMAIRKRLRAFIQLIYEQLGSYLIPFSDRGLSTIGELVKQGKRVLIGYAYKFDPRQLPDSSLFWPAVTHLWAHTDKLVDLETYISEHICKPERDFQNGHHLRSVMAELTPTVEGVLFRRYHGLRELSALVNMHFEQWFRYQWWNCSNIVAADFFLGSDIVEISIDANRQRFQ